jgi:tRNA 2-thiouridine synthesizing protein E
MNTTTYKGKTFKVDDMGFLADFRDWSEEFAEALAPEVKIPGGLVQEHWNVIYYIRNAVKEFGKCPLVFQTCKENGLRLHQLKELFPTGYLRGACKLAGLTYIENYLYHYTYLPIVPETPAVEVKEKTYVIDVRGFLVHPEEWDEQFAVYRAQDMKMPLNLTEKHWQIIKYLRESYAKNKQVPTVYETCEAFGLEIDQLGDLFPDGYHRGAVKIAGLRVR